MSEPEAREREGTVYGSSAPSRKQLSQRDGEQNGERQRRMAGRIGMEPVLGLNSECL